MPRPEPALRPARALATRLRSPRITQRFASSLVLGALVLLLGSPVLLLGTGGCAPTPGTIGAVLGQQSDGRVYLREVPPDLAAAQAGLKEGDELLLIEGQDVRQMTSDQIHAALEGDVGQPVRLTAVRGNRILRVTVTRTPAQKRSVPPPPDTTE